jgi:peptidoglycan/LPS O-acetylase OafA/YrhL
LTGLRRFEHVPDLDSTRGVAVIAVVLGHLWIVWPSWVWEPIFSRAGFLGVDLFFVLSGFLITTLLVAEQGRRGTVRLPSFYWRRALRLLPALWLLLAAHAIYASRTGYPPFGRHDFEWDSIQAAGLYYMNWHALWNPLSAAYLSPIWSLSIEGQFYLVWPFVVVGLIGVRRSRAVVVGVLVTALVIASVWRLFVFDWWGWSAAYLRSDTHIDGLLMGSLVGAVWIRGWTPNRLPRWLLLPAAVIVAGLFSRIDASKHFAYAGGITMFVAVAGVVVLVLVTNPRPEQGPTARALAWVGELSYGIYLWHYPVFWAFTRWGETWTNWERTLSAVAITAAGVTVSRVLVELPALRLKARRVDRPRDHAVRGGGRVTG